MTSSSSSSSRPAGAFRVSSSESDESDEDDDDDEDVSDEDDARVSASGLDSKPIFFRAASTAASTLLDLDPARCRCACAAASAASSGRGTHPRSSHDARDPPLAARSPLGSRECAPALSGRMTRAARAGGASLGASRERFVGGAAYRGGGGGISRPSPPPGLIPYFSARARDRLSALRLALLLLSFPSVSARCGIVSGARRRGASAGGAVAGVATKLIGFVSSLGRAPIGDCGHGPPCRLVGALTCTTSPSRTTAMSTSCASAYPSTRNSRSRCDPHFSPSPSWIALASASTVRGIPP